MSAPIGDRFMMLVRELPTYLSVAHSVSFPETEEQKKENCVKRFFRIVGEYFKLIGEILSYPREHGQFMENSKELKRHFSKINQQTEDNITGNKNDKPICNYFVSAQDFNGTVLGNDACYYHLYKIKQLERHYNVVARVVKSTQDLFDGLKEDKARFGNREIKLVDIVAHGDSGSLCIKDLFKAKSFPPNFEKDDIHNDQFRDCARDCAIIIDACSTGEGENSIAEEWARRNPGKTVFAPGAPLFFSKPIIKTINKMPKVEHVVHGFAVFNAYTNKKFTFEGPITRPPVELQLGEAIPLGSFALTE